MNPGIRKGVRLAAVVVLPIAAVFAGGNAFMHKQFPQFYADNSVYNVSYDKPKGWIEVPPGPFTLFVFRDPKGHGTLRASVNEVQSSLNPTPELDTSGIAEHYIGLTKSNMPEWTANRLEDISTNTETFSLIKRVKKDRVVYSAFCAKGNTTIVVSLTGGGKQVEDIDSLLPDFRKLVASFRLTHKDIVVDD